YAIRPLPDPLLECSRFLTTCTPTVNRFRFMNSVIVANDINLAIAFPEDLLEVIQQLAEEGVVFLRPQDVISLPRGRTRAPQPESVSGSCPGSGLQVARLLASTP